MIYISHRGVKEKYQENTIEALLAAAKAGFDSVEFDVRRLADGTLIIHHDPVVDGELLSEMSISDVKKRFPYIPTLEEVLKTLKVRLLLNVELKEKGYEEDVIALLDKYVTQKDYFVTSFNPLSLIKLKRKFPEVACGLLVARKIHNLIFLPLVDYALPLIPLNGFIKIVCRVLKKTMIIWGVTENDDLKELSKIENLCGIITDSYIIKL